MLVENYQTLVITARKQSLGQGNVFTSVCLSTGGVGFPACITSHTGRMTSIQGEGGWLPSMQHRSCTGHLTNIQWGVCIGKRALRILLESLHVLFTNRKRRLCFQRRLSVILFTWGSPSWTETPSTSEQRPPLFKDPVPSPSPPRGLGTRQEVTSYTTSRKNMEPDRKWHQIPTELSVWHPSFYQKSEIKWTLIPSVTPYD